ncbi:MAG TPA: hypothetical protein VHD61_15045 [Lacunisphaera sp.]|nr:hypothetical protein [Lacunisphaera sp.]
MKKPTFSQRLRLTGLLLAGTAVAVFLGGCVGADKMLAANQKLLSTSADAKQYTQLLQKAVESEDSAVTALRGSLRDVANGGAQALQDKAGAAVEAAYWKAGHDLQAAYAALLARWLDQTRAGTADLEEALKKGLAPLEEIRKTAKASYETARQRAGEYPGDATRRDEANRALQTYLAATAKVYEVDDDARAQVAAAWAQADKDLRAQLADLLKSKQADLDKARGDALVRIAAAAAKPVDLGADPSKVAPSFQTLLDYCDGVNKTGTANVQYLKLYSFGKGSLFEGFVDNLGKGLLAGVTAPAGTKTPTWNDVATSGTQVATDVKSALTGAADAATTTLRQEGNTLLDQAKTAAGDKLKSITNELVQKHTTATTTTGTP